MIGYPESALAGRAGTGRLAADATSDGDCRGANLALSWRW